jgi:hypothetical protein
MRQAGKGAELDGEGDAAAPPADARATLSLPRPILLLVGSCFCSAHARAAIGRGVTRGDDDGGGCDSPGLLFLLVVVAAEARTRRAFVGGEARVGARRRAAARPGAAAAVRRWSSIVPLAIDWAWSGDWGKGRFGRNEGGRANPAVVRLRRPLLKFSFYETGARVDDGEVNGRILREGVVRRWRCVSFSVVCGARARGGVERGRRAPAATVPAFAAVVAPPPALI